MKNCIKSDFNEIFLKLVANDRSDKRFLFTSKFCPLCLSAPDLRLYTFIKSWNDVYKVKGWIDVLNLQQMTIVIRPSCWHQNFGTNGLSAPAQGLCTCIKSWKGVHKIRGQRYFLKHATSDQSDKTFFLAPQKIVPKGCLLLHWSFIYMFEIKQNINYNNEAKGIFLELVQNDGNNKSFKMFPELVPSGCMPMPWGFFQMMTVGWLWPFFMTGSNLFLMLLYTWQLIEQWVLLYFQVCSNSAYPQHSGERYRTNGPLVFSCPSYLLSWSYGPLKTLV